MDEWIHGLKRGINYIQFLEISMNWIAELFFKLVPLFVITREKRWILSRTYRKSQRLANLQKMLVSFDSLYVKANFTEQIVKQRDIRQNAVRRWFETNRVRLVFSNNWRDQRLIFTLELLSSNIFLLLCLSYYFTTW